MEEKAIEITFKTDGTSTIEAFGFKGGACEKATAPYENALGVVNDRELKDSYYESPDKNVNLDRL